MPTTNASGAEGQWLNIAAGPIEVLLTGSRQFQFATTTGAQPAATLFPHAWPENQGLSLVIASGETLYARGAVEAITFAIDTAAV